MVSKIGIVFTLLASFLGAADQLPPPMRVVVAEGDGGQAGTANAHRAVIGRQGLAGNESAVRDICLNYVEAQFTYLRAGHGENGRLVFAQKIRSSPGRRDGLFWPQNDTADESPMGPRFAAAAIAEDPAGARPWFGYYFKILLTQAPPVTGGERDYRVDGRLIGGFALIAWPAEHGVTGVRSFVVSHLGDVYAKDLGADTHRAALGMTAFAPDRSWKKIASTADDE